jgi:hypothetical protein
MDLDCAEDGAQVVFTEYDTTRRKLLAHQRGESGDFILEARQMLAEFGWTDPVDLGGLAAARGLEGLMPFWLSL